MGNELPITVCPNCGSEDTHEVGRVGFSDTRSCLSCHHRYNANTGTVTGQHPEWFKRVVEATKAERDE